MSLGKTLLLGFIAGVTILLGLPIGRMKRPAPRMRLMLNAVAVGILLFLVWDVLSAAWAPIDDALTQFHHGDGGLGTAFGYGLLFAGGIAVGLLSLVAYEKWMARATRDDDAGELIAGATPDTPLPPAALSETSGGVAVLERTKTFAVASWSPAKQLALLIAVGIGLHNFGEGLAIGQAAASSEIALATLLVIGFALHNATEGFGICGPMSAEGTRPSWAFLGLMGLIGGGPTFLGTVLGQAWSSEAVSVVFFTVAAGSILYVVQELFAVNRRFDHPRVVTWLVLAGIVLGFATDFVVTAAGV